MAAPSNANRRLLAEVTRLKTLASDPNAPVKFIVEQSPFDTPPTSNLIIGRIFPKSEPYRQGSFRIEITLPAEYPFRPPEVRLLTPIYHPNVDVEGKICVELLNAKEAWRPTTQLVDIIKAVVDVIDSPKIDHALNPDIAREYTENRAEFNRKALESVKKHALPLN